MKTLSIILICCICAMNCTRVSADINPNPKPGSENDDPVRTDITSIYDLNKKVTSINSHASEWQTAVLELDYRSIVQLAYPQIPTSGVRYTRIKRMQNGSYLLTFQGAINSSDSNGRNVFYAISSDWKHWECFQEPLFAESPMKNQNSTLLKGA